MITSGNPERLVLGEIKPLAFRIPAIGAGLTETVVDEDDCACPDVVPVVPMRGILDLQARQGTIVTHASVAGQDLTIAIPTV